jgi:hypothetical protein
LTAWKDSAPIILAALAKELNGGESNDGWYIVQKDCSVYDIGLHSTAKFDMVNFKDKPTAQKAIDILTQIAPQILKNYFA